jgi:hypothetical protein
MLLGLEAILVVLGMMAGALSESLSMSVYSGNFVGDLVVVMGPFAGMVAFLYFQIIKY